MTRPFFLQRLSGRVSRKVHGVEHIPAHHPTERDYEMAALMLGFTAGACAMAFAVLLIVTFYWRPTC